MEDKELDLKPIEERLDKAYPGPWIDDVDGDDGGLRVYREGHTYDSFHIWFGDMEETDGIDHHTAAFVSNARQDIPLLIAEVKRLRAELHKPKGTALVVQYPHTNEAIGVTQFLDYQPQEKIWCSCGAIYPKGQDHKH